jgi:hypothetical protein
MRITVAEALALTDRELWQLGQVTVSGWLYANMLVNCLVDQQGAERGIFLIADPTEGEESICERLLDSECGGFAIGGGTVLFCGPTEVTGKLSRMSFPMLPLSMGQISRIVHRGREAKAAGAGKVPHGFSVLPAPDER